VKGLFHRTWGSIKQFFAVITEFLLSFVNVWDVSIDDFQKIHDDVQTCIANSRLEVEKLRSFKFDPKWKTRVINVPIAIDQVKDFVDLLTKDFVERLKQIEQPVHDLVLIWKNEQITKNLAQDQGVSGMSRAVHWLNEVQTTIHQIADAVHSASELTQLFNDITDKIKSAEPLFLQQGNSRQWITKHERQRVRAGQQTAP
jgi:hypothetical protein